MKFQDWPLMNEKNLMPELRFPEFKGEWALEELEQCLDYLQPTPFLVESVNYSDEYETPVLTAGKSFILGFTNEKEGVFNENLPVIIFDDFTTASQFVDFAFKTKSSAMKILLARNGYDIKFVHESMQTLNYEVGVHKRHWISVFSKLRIAVPKPKEQQKIASCLSSLDELIAAHNDKLAALKDHKKGLLQNLFPQEGEAVPKVRFSEFEGAGEWVEKKLGKVAKFLSGGTPSKSNPLYWGGTIPWISAASMHETQVHDSESKITEQAVSAGTRIVNEGTILILVRGSMLFNRVPICITMKAVSFNQDVKALMLNENCTTRFMFYHLLAYESFIPIDKTGIGAGKIGLEELKELTLHIPKSGEEQQKIASCLSAADELITAQQERIEQLQQHKKGLMQGLFPKIER